MPIDQVHPRLTSTTPKCIIDDTLQARAILGCPDSRQKLRYLHNRVIGEVANSTLCVKFAKFSVNTRRTYSHSGSWYVSPEDIADFDGGRMEIGAFGKLTLEVVKPDYGPVQIGVDDVANIFQSIWAKLNDDNNRQEITCMLPPFKGRLVYGTDSENDVYRSWRLSYVEDSLEWFVQERQGLDFRTLPGLFYVNKHGLHGGTSNATRGVDVYEPTQNKDFDYDLPEAAQPSSGHRDNPLVDGRWTNNSSSIASESSEELPRPDSPTINLDLQLGTARGHNIRPGLSPTRAHLNFTIGRALPFPETPLSKIHSGVSERREDRYFRSNRAGRSAEEVHGHRDQPKVHMPKGPYARLDSYSDHRDPHLWHTQDGRESFIVETSESLDQELDDQDFQDEERACDDAHEYHEATNRITYQADDSPSLHSQSNLGELLIQSRRVITRSSESYQSKLGELLLLETDMSECGASESSISRQHQESLQSSQNIYQDTIDTPRRSWEPEDDQVGELVKDGPGVLPLRDQFGEHYQTNVLPPLYLDMFTGNPDSLNYRDHSTGGLTFANTRDNITLDKRKGWMSRFSRRLKGLYPG